MHVGSKAIPQTQQRAVVRVVPKISGCRASLQKWCHNLFDGFGAIYTKVRKASLGTYISPGLNVQNSPCTVASNFKNQPSLRSELTVYTGLTNSEVSLLLVNLKVSLGRIMLLVHERLKKDCRLVLSIFLNCRTLGALGSCSSLEGCYCGLKQYRPKAACLQEISINFNYVFNIGISGASGCYREPIA